jgi:hypothetical protein
MPLLHATESSLSFASPALVVLPDVWRSSQEPALVRAQSNATNAKKTLVRRHSSGEHAFLPNRAERNAIKESQKSFGVPSNLVQDREVNISPPPPRVHPWRFTYFHPPLCHPACRRGIDFQLPAATKDKTRQSRPRALSISKIDAWPSTDAFGFLISYHAPSDELKAGLKHTA